jgi:hypothetical protein
MSSGIELTTDLKEGFSKYFKAVEDATVRAKKEMALLGLNWMVNGSPNNDMTPPILLGILRGSGSAFVGREKIGDTKSYNAQGTPNESHTDDDNVITWGFNTAYAARVHEGLPPAPGAFLKPGPGTRQAGDAGGKYVEWHIRDDGKDLMKLLAQIIKKDTNG